jgi:phage terminase large subunit GpA-like protein
MAKCPHCDEVVSLEETRRETHDEIQRDVQGIIKKEAMYSCPHCDRVLGFAFFLGGALTGRPA